MTEANNSAAEAGESAAPAQSSPAQSSPAQSSEAQPSEAQSSQAQPAADAQSQSQPQPPRPFRAPAPTPTQSGPMGLRYDFNDGCRVMMPERKRPWRVRLTDLDTANILFDVTLKEGRVNSTKRYFLRIRIEVWNGDNLVLTHDFDARNRDVLVQLPVGTLGDSLGWFPYAARFRERHGCRLSVSIAAPLVPLFKDAYPDITFLTPDEVKPERFYATYNIGLFFDDADNIFQPCDFRLVGLHRTAGYILGVDPAEEAPRIALDDDTPPIAEPYVCIAVQSSTRCKYWNNPGGWPEIVRFLKEAGYRVVCIDQKPFHGTDLTWMHLPHGCEDETGDRPLKERARWIRHAAFFVGLSSGLAWLAWAVGTPVVMISGFTHPTNEFHTPWRVINYHACNSCWNDPKVRFDHSDFLWCPRHKGTARHYECTRLITAEQVKATIRTIPAFQHLAAGSEARSLQPAAG